MALCCALLLPNAASSSRPTNPISQGRAVSRKRRSCHICAAHSSEGPLQFATRSFALAAAAVVLIGYANPAVAFKGGGPYGSDVTRGQDLSGKDFSGLTLTKQDFKTSILRQAKFHDAKLVGASFFDANLTGADFSEADLRGADFSLADASKANFRDADLTGALVTGNTSFKGATITGAGEQLNFARLRTGVCY